MLVSCSGDPVKHVISPSVSYYSIGDTISQCASILKTTKDKEINKKFSEVVTSLLSCYRTELSGSS